MLDTVVALINEVGLTSPTLYGRRIEEVLRKGVAGLVAAAVMVLTMLVAVAPAFAQGEGGCDINPGQTEGARSKHPTPPEQKPGIAHRSADANEHDEGVGTGFGDRVEECA
jgi:hypothetical protein